MEPAANEDPNQTEVPGKLVCSSAAACQAYGQDLTLTMYIADGVLVIPSNPSGRPPPPIPFYVAASLYLPK